MHQLQIIDSHTEGEATRCVVSGAPDLGDGTLAEKRLRLGREYDWLRTACILEPRGADFLVGALLCEPSASDCVAGVIFFNNAGLLNGCLHGTIGVVKTLEHLGRISLGEHKIETPVGIVTVSLQEGHRVRVTNVPSMRHAHAVTVDVPGFGDVTGDVAWGGNWFFLVEEHGQELHIRNVEALTRFCRSTREALKAQGITGAGGMEIDHVELFGPAANDQADSKNFVLCPGNEYDRSPCGTGTSAKLACLHAVGKLAPGELWRQASILDTVFEGEIEIRDGAIIPHVTGRAYITAQSTLLLDPEDPFRHGIHLL